MRRQALRKTLSWEEPPINMTPLIDVVFVILIVFIVIAPLLDVDRIELADGRGEQRDISQHQDQNPITVHVYADNSIKFNDQKVLLPQLKGLLSTARKSYPGVRPQLYHDKKATFGTYQSVKNAVELAGFDEMDLVLMPSSP